MQQGTQQGTLHHFVRTVSYAYAARVSTVHEVCLYVPQPVHRIAHAVFQLTVCVSRVVACAHVYHMHLFGWAHAWRMHAAHHVLIREVVSMVWVLLALRSSVLIVHVDLYRTHACRLTSPSYKSACSAYSSVLSDRV